MRAGDVVNGKYEIIRLLGEGGMGAVYEARHRALNRRFALKFLHGELGENVEAHTRFLHEAKVAAIGSEHVVQVTDVGTAEDGSPFLVMEYLDGPDLRQVIGRAKSLDVEKAARLAIQICHALGAAHSQGIVHRDLKPENIIVVTASDGTERIKVLDFGIAKFHDIHLTATGSVIGTPQYMSPEQARGTRDVDHRADIYSVGAILFEMLTGEPPYSGVSMTDILVKVITQAPPAPRDLKPEIPAEAERVVLKAMARDRDDRYATMDDLTVALRSLSRSPTSPPTSVPTMSETSGRAGASTSIEGFAPPPAAQTPDPAPQAGPTDVRTLPQRGRTIPAIAIVGAFALVLVALATTVSVCFVGRRTCIEPLGDTLIESRFATKIRPGSFEVRSDQIGGGAAFGAPVRITVTRAFVLSKTEVTQLQFEKLMGYNPSTFASCGPICPVETVTWHEAALFTNALSSRRRLPTCYLCVGSRHTARCERSPELLRIQDCQGFRLPTEAEWELAARAGATTDTPINDVQPHEVDCFPLSSALAPVGWYCGNSGNRTHPVKALRPNALGLFDMLGNVAEWCDDWYGPSFGDVPIDPPGTAHGTHKVIRGGGFEHRAWFARNGSRAYGQPDVATASVGFRVARTKASR